MELSFFVCVCMYIYRLRITTISQPTVGETRRSMDTDSSSDSWADTVVPNTPLGAIRRQYRNDNKLKSLRRQKDNRVNYVHVSLGRNR